MVNPRRFVVLISGRGSNLQAILDALHAGRISGELVAVISNRASAPGLQLAMHANVATHIVAAQTDESRAHYDARLIACIDALHADFIVLAGFMRIFSADFIAHYVDRILNIHPSLLPAHKGLHTHQRALAAGDSEHGASVHFVTTELDSGAIVIQSVVDVRTDDDASTLATRVLATEHIIYPMAIQWFIEGRLRCTQQQLYFDQQPLATPLLWKHEQLINMNLSPCATHQ
jgi:phosphoribosylglycinamide formyltransferase-1